MILLAGKVFMLSKCSIYHSSHLFSKIVGFHDLFVCLFMIYIICNIDQIALDWIFLLPEPEVDFFIYSYMLLDGSDGGH